MLVQKGVRAGTATGFMDGGACPAYLDDALIGLFVLDHQVSNSLLKLALLFITANL
ncbi:MAG: hypothetical protein AAF400_00655 [Bacteroidota bacterium]